MAAVMTYDSLYNNILDYLERNDDQTIAQVPNFIMLAEQVIASQIKFLGNLTVNESTMVVGQNVIPKPARWHKTVSMNVTVGTISQPVFLRKYEYLKEYAPDSTAVGTPKYYGDYDYTHWLVAPTPDVAYSFEVLYYERVQPLDATNQSNWFTVYAPQAMLYGSLLQAMPYLKNDERMAMWQQQFDLIINTLKTEDTLRTGDRQAVAMDS
jgi:hypothetical protein